MGQQLEFGSIEPAVADMQRRLEELQKEVSGLLTELRTPSATPANPKPTALRVEQILRLRRTRDEVFGKDLFADPAWDILLESYAAHLRQQRNSISSLCAVSAAPATTALRWIAKLEQDGLLARNDDPLDHRRTWIRLTEQGISAMNQYFDLVASRDLVV